MDSSISSPVPPKMKSLLAFSSLAIFFAKPVLSQVSVYGQCGVRFCLLTLRFNCQLISFLIGSNLLRFYNLCFWVHLCLLEPMYVYRRRNITIQVTYAMDRLFSMSARSCHNGSPHKYHKLNHGKRRWWRNDNLDSNVSRKQCLLWLSHKIQVFRCQ